MRLWDWLAQQLDTEWMPQQQKKIEKQQSKTADFP
jgi:hypothetical protein